MNESKLLSGRWFLTIVCGIVFCYATIERILPPEAVVSIITMVFVEYFQRKDRKENGKPV